MIDCTLNDLISKVVFINLDARTDRKSQAEDELQLFLPDKVIRFSAIQDKPGSVGCSKSHIQILQMAIQENWPNVLIVEDDLQFINQDQALPQIQSLFQKDWKVIVLGASFAKVGPENRLLEGQSTVAYIVKRDQYETLLANFQEGLFKLLETQESKQCIDQHWKLLQAKDPWYTIRPSFVTQRPSFSDVENRYVNYQSFF